MSHTQFPQRIVTMMAAKLMACLTCYCICLPTPSLAEKGILSSSTSSSVTTHFIPLATATNAAGDADVSLFDTAAAATRRKLNGLDIFEHLKQEHQNGNAQPKFTAVGEMWQAPVKEITASQSGITPETLFSLYGRPSRRVGDLGFSFLVVDHDVDVGVGAADEGIQKASFAFLMVDWNSEKIRGVVICQGNMISIMEEDSVKVATNLQVSQETPGVKNNARSLTSTTTVTAAEPSYLYQIDLFLEIDRPLLQNIASFSSDPLCITHLYINSLITAANSILEYEIKTHLNVIFVNQTKFYEEDSLDNTEKVLEKMKSIHARKEENNEGGWHYRGVDLHYALLGKDLSNNDEATILKNNNNKGRNGTVCDPERGFGVMGNIKGYIGSLDERWLFDLKRFVKMIG